MAITDAMLTEQATTPPATHAAERVIVIRPTQGWSALQLRDVWEYRDLLFMLVSREFKGRYRQMALGPLWIVIQPVVNMLVFSFIFGSVARLPTDGVPYPIFTYVALLPWQLFATGVRSASQSLVQQQAVISKVYFPRLVIPLASILSACIDYGASLVVLVLMLVLFGVPLRWEMLVYIPLSALAAVCALGVGLWLAGFSVKYRDVALGVQFALPIWQYLTPVAYAGSLVPAAFAGLYRMLNPMTPIIEASRWAMLGGDSGPGWALAAAALIAVGLLVSGAFFFRRSERDLVDLL